MAKQRRCYKFKAKVALEALRGKRPIQDIAAKYGVHPNQVSTCKKQAVEYYARRLHRRSMGA